MLSLIILIYIWIIFDKEKQANVLIFSGILSSIWITFWYNSKEIYINLSSMVRITLKSFLKRNKDMLCYHQEYSLTIQITFQYEMRSYIVISSMILIALSYFP